jgi:hypothetical protein
MHMAWRLRQPPSVTQGEGYKCWAAAMESWLKVTPGRPKWPQELLLSSAGMFTHKTGFEPPGTGLPPGAIDANGFKEMVASEIMGIRMMWEETPQGTSLGDEDIFDKLWEHGYLYVSFTSSRGNDPNQGFRHCVVVWGADADGNIQIMNPTTGAYENKTVDYLRSPLLIAYRPPELFTL